MKRIKANILKKKKKIKHRSVKSRKVETMEKKIC